MAASNLTASAHAERGLPRPIHEDKEGTLRPVPWSQDGERWGVTDDDRLLGCTYHGRCLVCGDVVEEGTALVNTERPFGRPQLPLFATMHSLRDDVYVADGGALHDRCAKITRAHCLTVRGMLKTGELVERPFLRTEIFAHEPADALTATPASRTLSLLPVHPDKTGVPHAVLPLFPA